nr:HAD family hydrolase [Sansalvadorimonas sp. 2012CJ34-2]
MKDWDEVQAVDGAHEVLRTLSENYLIYLATGADTTPDNIETAMKRVGLSSFISRYFCHQVLGEHKSSVKFYHAIIRELDLAPAEIVMIGDSLDKDILPAKKAGMRGIWLAQGSMESAECKVTSIRTLEELVSILN